MSKIHFVITGGTIDSVYDGAKDTVVPSRTSIIPTLAKSFKIEDVKFTQVCMKDSRSLTKNDIRKILQTIKRSSSKKIIVTHGTYTMPDTARFLKANLKPINKVILLTGSVIPILGFSPSDGTFNLGYAMGKLDSLKPGVYVAMHGRIFNPDEVLKNIREARFQSIFSKY